MQSVIGGKRLWNLSKTVRIVSGNGSATTALQKRGDSSKFLKVRGNCLWKAVRGSIRYTWKKKRQRMIFKFKCSTEGSWINLTGFESEWFPNFIIRVLTGGLLGQWVQSWAFPNSSAKCWGNWIRINKRSQYRNRCWHRKGIPTLWLLAYTCTSCSQSLWVKVIT